MNVPTTDEEAESNLRKIRRGIMGESMAALFRVIRAQGVSLLDAYREALEASLPEELKSQEVCPASKGPTVASCENRR